MTTQTQQTTTLIAGMSFVIRVAPMTSGGWLWTAKGEDGMTDWITGQIFCSAASATEAAIETLTTRFGERDEMPAMMEMPPMTESNQLPAANRSLTAQLAEAKVAADTAHAVEQRRQRDWASALWFMAGSSHALHGSDLMAAMNRLTQLAQEAYAAHQETSIADNVLMGLTELVNRHRTADR